MEMNCDLPADYCEFTCNDDNLVPYPFSTITCDMVPQNIPARCAGTGCGDPSGWNYGDGFSEVTVSCNSTTGTCDLTCVDTPGRTFPYPVMHVQCKTHVLTPSAGSIIRCAG